MTTLGIIGGIAPESTIEYYRLIVSRYRQIRNDGSYPSIIINSIDLTAMIRFPTAGDLDGLTEHLLRELQRLADARVDFGLFASNTPHIVFDRVAPRSPIPLISIVETARDEVARLGMKRVGLLGTRFTMNGTFYPEVFAAQGIEVVAPQGADQSYVHDKYMGELVNGVFRDDTRIELLEIIDRLRRSHNIQGLILGGTELPLILRESPDPSFPFIDTTKIHVEAAVARLV